MQQIKLSLCTLFIFTCTLFIGCKKDELLSSEKKIISFSVNNTLGKINDTTKTISINGKYNWDVRNLVAKIIISEKSSISPKSDIAQNFTNPVTYKVTAEDGSTQSFTANVNIIKNDLNDILKFDVLYKTQRFTGIVYPDQKEVRIALPFSNVKLDSLSTDIQVSDYATIFPSSGSRIDSLHLKQVFTVSAQNGTKKEYTVTVQNSENKITWFNIPALTGRYFSSYSDYQEDAVGLGNTYFVAHVLSNVDLSNLCPNIRLSDRAVITPALGTFHDFNNDFNYTIKSESGSEKTYKIRIIKCSILLINDESMIVYNGIRGDGSVIALNYSAISEIDKAEFINMATNEITPCTATSTKMTESSKSGYTYYVYFYPISKPLVKGKYKLRVYLKNGENILTRCKIEVGDF